MEIASMVELTMDNWAREAALRILTHGPNLDDEVSVEKIAAIISTAAEPLVALLKESRREHYHCTDSWFCCGKCTHPDHPKSYTSDYPSSHGPRNGVEIVRVSAVCDCGVDAWNARVDAALKGEQSRSFTAAATKFRKKPIVLDAWLFDGSYESYAVIPSGGLIRWFSSGLSGRPPCLEIQTLEGTMTAWAGDFIIKGVKGEFYPCKPDIFEVLYEPV